MEDTGHVDISEMYTGRQNSQCKGPMRGSNVYVRNSNNARTAGIEQGRDGGRKIERSHQAGPCCFMTFKSKKHSRHNFRP